MQMMTEILHHLMGRMSWKIYNCSINLMPVSLKNHGPNTCTSSIFLLQPHGGHSWKKTSKIHSKDKLQLITTCRLLFHQNPPWRLVSVNGCQFQGMLSNVSKNFMDRFEEDDFLWLLDLQIACHPTGILWWGVKCTHDHRYQHPRKSKIYTGR